MRNPIAFIRRESNRSIFSALLRTRRRFGAGMEILVDHDDRRMTFSDIVRAAFGLGRVISRQTKKGEAVGILLPTGAGFVVAYFALLAYRRVPALLNFTAGARNLHAACKAAEVTQVLTAHAFIEQGGLHDLRDDLEKSARMIYLEDEREKVGTLDKIMAVIGPYLGWLFYPQPRPGSPGTILFTSGTEGDPKGVVLSHRNILANIAQVNAHVEIFPHESMFNPLPTFHSYGLTAGTLFPMLSGRKTILHPSPLMVKVIPQRIRETQANIMVATDTFLQQYARAGKSGDLQSLRLAVCGAERVRDETRAFVRKRFDLEVLEGYGVTEASPVLAANQPEDIRPGTVGKFLPAVEYKLEDVEGLSDNAGRLFVRGPNIMMGYLSVDRPGEIQELEDGWHDTGDVVSVDKEGYVTIRDRVKRFAKIGGEMVSLSVVENCASAIWPDHMHAAAALPDTRKGEQIILLSECKQANIATMTAWARSHGVSALAVPKRIFHVDHIPVLGTGKTNYGEVKKMAQKFLSGEEDPISTDSGAPAHAGPAGEPDAKGDAGQKDDPKAKPGKRKDDKTPAKDDDKDKT